MNHLEINIDFWSYLRGMQNQYLLRQEFEHARNRIQKIVGMCSQMMIKLVHEVEGLRQQNKTIFCWLPGYTEISSNESIDAAEEKASRKCAEIIPGHYRNWGSIIFDKISERWKA